MRCSMGPGREVPPLDDIDVVWKDLAACCKTVGSAERGDGHKELAREVYASKYSVRWVIFRDIGITEGKLSKRYRGQSDLYYGG